MRINKKMKRAALSSALTDALASGKLALVDEISFEAPKTSDAAALLETLGLIGKVLLVLPAPEEIAEKSFRNLPWVKVTYARSLSVYDVLAADRVLFTTASLDALSGTGAAAAASGRGTRGPASEDGGAGPTDRNMSKARPSARTPQEPASERGEADEADVAEQDDLPRETSDEPTAAERGEASDADAAEQEREP
jgi:hypothetical protein